MDSAKMHEKSCFGEITVETAAALNKKHGFALILNDGKVMGMEEGSRKRGSLRRKGSREG